ncbi:MAG: glycosyltransferase family 2 protein [FCB group bacterium]|nr:glycosyltransferase family 2 protein [FCB group bacterium]
MKLISAVIITKNEEKNISRCLESIKWVDEIILIDSQSDDQTVAIAQKYNARVFSPEWKGYGKAKKEGVNYASHDWILSVDADEVVSEELKKEIQAVLDNNSFYAGYYIPRKTQFLGRWIKHCGWYPDYVLRLFRKSRGNFNEAYVHEKVVLQGDTTRLKNELLHYSYPDLESYFKKFNRYTTMGAEEAFQQGIKTGWFKIAIKPVISFFIHYIMKQGLRDGMEGFLVSVLSSLAVMVKYAKLKEKVKNKQNEKIKV